MDLKKRPHVIIFNPDEMRWDTMGHMGNPAARTPFLDQFAREQAVSFRNAVCQNPVCVPSRCSFFTGLYPHVRGHRTMAHLLRPGESSLFSELKHNGYKVWMNARNDLYAAQYPGWLEENTTELFYGGLTKKAPGPEVTAIRGEPGGKQYYSHYEGRLRLDETGRNYSRDDEAVDAAIDWVLGQSADQPLCLFLGLMNPHTPYAVEEPYYTAIDRSQLPPRIASKDCRGKPRMEQRLRELQQMQAYTEADWDELRAVYLGMCSKVDALFARLCDGLRRAGIYEDCAIFFLSDHGDFAGDYDLPEKAQNCFEDCLVKVPFLVKPPQGTRVDPGISDSLVELVDFYATVMDYAGVQSDHTHFGKSLRPVLEDRRTELREYVCCEGGRMPGESHCDESHINGPDGAPPSFVYWPRQRAQREDETHLKGTMIRDLRYKYICRVNGADEFYDLLEDPGERINAIDEPRYAGEIWRLQLQQLRWYQATCDIVPLDYDARFNREMLWGILRSSAETQEEQAQMRRWIDGGANMAQVLGQLAVLRAGRQSPRET